MQHVDTYIFDLDYTLYPASSGLMEQMNVRMQDYMVQHFDLTPNDATTLRRNYWKKYGTTLSGLMAEYDINPRHFLDFVHDVDINHIEQCQRTRNAIEALDGRKIIYTNADDKHAKRMLAHLGLADLFDVVYDLTGLDYTPKPDPVPYHRILQSMGVKAPQCAMFEDSSQNLRTAHNLGMTTIWVTDDQCEKPAFVHHKTNHIATFLEGATQ